MSNTYNTQIHQTSGGSVLQPTTSETDLSESVKEEIKVQKPLNIELSNGSAQHMYSLPQSTQLQVNHDSNSI